MSLRDSGKAFYIYGIEKLEENKNNSNIIDVYFGNKTVAYHIHKVNLNNFVISLLPEFDDLYKYYFNKNNGFTVSDANQLLKGRAIVVVTDFKNILEYCNGGQNGIIGVTTLGLDGDFKAKTLDTLFKDNVTYEELYPKTNPIATDESEREDV